MMISRASLICALIFAGATLLGCPSERQPSSTEADARGEGAQPNSEPSSPGRSKAPGAPPETTPDACESQDAEPTVACEVSTDSVVCRLAGACGSELVMKGEHSAWARAWRWTSSGIDLGRFSYSEDHRALNLDHKQAPGTPIFVFLSETTIAIEPAGESSGEGSKSIRSVRGARPTGHGFLALLSVPGSELPEAPEVVSGKSIGPVRLGMTEAELEALQLSPRLTSSTEAVRSRGLYDVSLQKGRVVQIAYHLTPSGSGLRYKGRSLPADATLTQLTAALPRCGGLIGHILGMMVTCDQGRTKLLFNEGNVTEVWVQRPRLGGAR